MLSELWQAIQNKRIVILGFGKEGRSSLAFLRRHWAEVKPVSVTVADKQPLNPAEVGEDVATVSGEDYLQAMREADLVLKSPGISFKDYTIERRNGRSYLREFPGAEISGQMDLFLRYAPARIVGVSGTKGKSTTTTFCHKILEQAFGAEKTYLMGNIGVPVLDYIDELDEQSYCAVELSSHQLEFCQASPEVAVLTNFHREHLDHYKDYEDYLQAKINILRYQKDTDTAVLMAAEKELMAKAPAYCRGRLITVGDVKLSNYAGGANDFMLLEGRQFEAEGKIYELPANPAMLGRHVYRDALLAAAACHVFGVPVETALKAFASFAGIRHRLEPLGEFAGIRFYNDSIATIPESTMPALEALAEVGRVTTLLTGGMDRGIPYEDFAKFLFTTDLKQIITLPDTGRIVGAHVAALNAGRPLAEKIRIYAAADMEEAVRLAYLLSRPGEICLLSPAASSYNRYKNFEERGNHFRDLVRAMEDEYGGQI